MTDEGPIFSHITDSKEVTSLLSFLSWIFEMQDSIIGLHALGPAPHDEMSVEEREKAAFKMFILATLKSFVKMRMNNIMASCFPLKREALLDMKSSNVFIASTLSCHLGFVRIVSLNVSNSG